LLAGILAAAISAVVGAAALVKPIHGALGLEFGKPISHEVLGASLEPPTFPALPDNLNENPQAAGDTGQWYYFLPEALPTALAVDNTAFTVMVDNELRPLRILAERSMGACDETYSWFVDSLTKKYLTDGDPKIVPRIGFIQGARFTKDYRQVDVACGKSLLIEYTDAEALLRWQGQLQAHASERQSERAKSEQVARDIERLRQQQFADSFTLGDQFRLDGALGVAFGQSFPLPPDYLVDKPLAIALPNLPEPFAAGRYELTVGPQAEPVRLEGRLPDGNGDAFNEVRSALQAKFGPPMKNSQLHVIHRVNGNFFVLRRLKGLRELNIAVIDTRAERAKTARATAAAQRAFEEATQGL
jgi:hypothetical protein